MEWSPRSKNAVKVTINDPHPPHAVRGPVSPVDMLFVDVKTERFLASAFDNHLGIGPVQPTGGEGALIDCLTQPASQYSCIKATDRKDTAMNFTGPGFDSEGAPEGVRPK